MFSRVYKTLLYIKLSTPKKFHQIFIKIDETVMFFYQIIYTMADKDKKNDKDDVVTCER